MPAPEFSAVQLPVPVLEVSIGDRKLGIFIDEVKELIQPASVSRVPKTHDFTKGVFRLRDHTYPLIDLPALFGEKNILTAEAMDEWKYVLVNYDAHINGLFVHAINNIITIDESHLLTEETLTVEEAQIAYGYIKIGNHNVLLLNVPSLISYIKQLNQAVI